ncbi:hypothetical protein ABIE66_004293 [Peribacillus sp. B2I2]
MGKAKQLFNKVSGYNNGEWKISLYSLGLTLLFLMDLIILYILFFITLACRERKIQCILNSLPQP